MSRVCSCNCGRSIDNQGPLVRKHPECFRRDRLAQKREYNKVTIRKTRPDRGEERLSVTNRRFLVRNNRIESEVPVRRQKPCQVCCGMPWARVPSRRTERLLDFRSVVNEAGVCRGCGEPYAPEPPPERMSVLGSSAGVAVREADTHGVVRHYTTKPRNTPSRAKFTP